MTLRPEPGSILSGVHLGGVDGLVLLATLAVVAGIANALRRTEPPLPTGEPHDDVPMRRPTRAPASGARGRSLVRRWPGTGLLTRVRRPLFGLPVLALALLLVAGGQRSLDGVRLTKAGLGTWL